jgi:single-strand DNA-binding protein
MFGKLADITEQWVHKGDRVYVEGRLEYSQTQDEQGGTRYWTDVVITEMVMLGSGQGGAGGGGGSRGGYEQPAAPAPRAKPLTEPDDDLPF